MASSPPIAGSGAAALPTARRTAQAFANPSALAHSMPPKQNLYIADTLNNMIRQLSLTGTTVSTMAGTAGVAADAPGPFPAALDQPDVMRLLPSGDLLVATHAPGANIMQIRAAASFPTHCWRRPTLGNCAYERWPPPRLMSF